MPGLEVEASTFDTCAWNSRDQGLINYTPMEKRAWMPLGFAAMVSLIWLLESARECI